jgi:hypothetical protein
MELVRTRAVYGRALGVLHRFRHAHNGNFILPRKHIRKPRTLHPCLSALSGDVFRSRTTACGPPHPICIIPSSERSLIARFSKLGGRPGSLDACSPASAPSGCRSERPDHQTVSKDDERGQEKFGPANVAFCPSTLSATLSAAGTFVYKQAFGLRRIWPSTNFRRTGPCRTRYEL